MITLFIHYYYVPPLWHHNLLGTFRTSWKAIGSFRTHLDSKNEGNKVERTWAHTPWQDAALHGSVYFRFTLVFHWSSLALINTLFWNGKSSTRELTHILSQHPLIGTLSSWHLADARYLGNKLEMLSVFVCVEVDMEKQIQIILEDETVFIF